MDVPVPQVPTKFTRINGGTVKLTPKLVRITDYGGVQIVDVDGRSRGVCVSSYLADYGPYMDEVIAKYLAVTCNWRYFVRTVNVGS